MENLVTAIGTPNIALVKYWGKRDVGLNLPYNSSLSMTLDESLNTKTSVLVSDRLQSDTIYIDGAQQKFDDAKEEKFALLAEVLNYMREAASSSSKVMIVSRNSFPSSAGLASSASGAATLVFALNEAFGLGLGQRELVIIARRISGSSCRGLMGGFVKWERGELPDGTDSYATQVADNAHWPEVVDLIALVSAEKKRISSSEGHRRTPSTSELFKVRPEIAERFAGMASRAIGQRDFQTLGEIIIKDSNNMHATMLDSYPPIMYLNDASRRIIYAIHDLNASEGRIVGAYTFDAGPNAHIITLKNDIPKIKAALQGIASEEKIIVAGQGSGPRVLDESESLIGKDPFGQIKM